MQPRNGHNIEKAGLGREAGCGRRSQHLCFFLLCVWPIVWSCGLVGWTIGRCHGRSSRTPQNGVDTLVSDLTVGRSSPSFEC